MLRSVLAGLRARLLLLVLLAMLPTLGLMLHTYIDQRSQAAADVEHNALRLARLAVRDNDQLIESTHQLLIVLAQIPQVRNGSSAECRALVADILKGFPSDVNLEAVNLDGDVFCTTLSSSTIFNVGNRNYFQRALQTRAFAIGGYATSRITGNPSVDVAFPILEAGAVQGVVVAGIDLPWFNNLTADAQLPPNTVLTVIDSNGIILARYPDPQTWVGQSLPQSPLTKAILTQGTGTAEMPDLDGASRLYAFRPLTSGTSRPDAYVSIGIPAAEAFAAVDQGLAWDLTALGIVAALAIAAAWFGGDLFILRRVATLVKATQRLAAGDLSARTGQSDDGGELSTLARNFDAMAEALQQREQQRQQSADALRESEQRYRQLVEFSPDAILINSERQIAFINSAGATLLGADDPHELIGKSVFDLIHLIQPDDQETVQRRIGRLLQAREPNLRLEQKWIRLDGQIITVEVAASPLIYQGKPAAQVILRDISERKRAEEALRASEEKYRMLFTNMLDGLALHELVYDEHQNPVDYIIRDVNPCFESILASRREAVIGQRATLVYGTSEAPYLERYAQVAATGKPLSFETYFPLLDRYFNVSVFSPGADQFATIFADITERKHAQGRIERQVAHLAALRTIDIAITASLDLRLTLDVLLEQVTKQLGIDAADVLLFEAPTQTLRYAAGRGFQTVALKDTRLRLGEGYAGRAAFERQLVSVPDLSDAPGELVRSPILPHEAFVAYYAAPLIAKGQVKGVLELFQRAPLNPNAEWLDFLETLAGQAAIAVDSAALFGDLQHSNAELALAYDTTLEGWSHALDLRDRETEGHTQRVTEMTVRLVQAMGVSTAELVHVRRGALLHDIGKMGIPDAILHKPGPLDEEEWRVMRLHPELAYKLLSPIAYLRPALDIPYCHHEQWDGSGYPRGLKGEQIPLTARIFAVVDVWDALRSDRPYRLAWPEEKVREHIRAGAGTHFDPQVVEAFLDMMPWNQEPAPIAGLATVWDGLSPRLARVHS